MQLLYSDKYIHTISKIRLVSVYFIIFLHQSFTQNLVLYEMLNLNISFKTLQYYPKTVGSLLCITFSI
jgi:hypothetical protein